MAYARRTQSESLYISFFVFLAAQIWTTNAAFSSEAEEVDNIARPLFLLRNDVGVGHVEHPNRIEGSTC